MEIIICENAPFGFQSLQVSKANQDGLEAGAVVTFQPNCNLQLLSDVDVNSLTFAEKEYFDRINRAGNSYHEKFGRHLCVHLNFASRDEVSLGVHGFPWENAEEGEHDLWMEKVHLSLKISLSMSVLQYKTPFDFIDKTISSPSPFNIGTTSKKTSKRLVAKSFENPNLTIKADNSKLTLAQTIPVEKSSSSKATDVCDATTAENSDSEETPLKNEESCSKASETSGGTLQFPTILPTSIPNPLKAGIYLVRSVVAEDKVRALRLGTLDGPSFEKEHETPACCLINTEIPFKPPHSNEVSGSHDESCIGKEGYLEKRGLKLPSNLSTFLTEKLFQAHPYFLAGVINVSIICNFNTRQRLTNQIEVCRAILQENVKSDVEIVAENGNIVKCHKNFLAAHSKVFDKDLQVSSKKCTTIDMRDISEESVHALLEYCYTGDVSAPHKLSKVAFELLKAANRFEISALETKMRDTLSSKVNDWFDLEVALNLFLFLREVEGSDTTDVLLKAVQAIKSNSKDLKTCELYRSIFKTNPEAGMDLCTYLAQI